MVVYAYVNGVHVKAVIDTGSEYVEQWRAERRAVRAG
jgi:hypothetical protein